MKMKQGSVCRTKISLGLAITCIRVYKTISYISCNVEMSPATAGTVCCTFLHLQTTLRLFDIISTMVVRASLSSEIDPMWRGEGGVVAEALVVVDS